MALYYSAPFSAGQFMVKLGNTLLQQQLDDLRDEGTAVPRWLRRWPVPKGAIAPYLARAGLDSTPKGAPVQGHASRECMAAE